MERMKLMLKNVRKTSYRAENPGDGIFGFRNIGGRLKRAALPVMITFYLLTGLMLFLGTGILWAVILLTASTIIPQIMYAIGQIADDTRQILCRAEAEEILSRLSGYSPEKAEKTEGESGHARKK